MKHLIEFIMRGGPFMYPIIACSVFALAIFMERLWATRRAATIPMESIKEIEEMVKKGSISEAHAVAKRENSVAGRLIAHLLARTGENLDMDNLRRSVETIGKTETAFLYRRVETLGTLASVATLLGLLGTISGMIKMFATISQKQFVNPADLAGGISEALYTTAAGLSVAIPTLLAYRYISSRIENIVVTLEEMAQSFVENIQNTQHLEKIQKE